MPCILGFGAQCWEQDYSLCGVHDTKSLLEQSQMSDMPNCLLQERILLINCLQDAGPAAPQRPLELRENIFLKCIPQEPYGREESENLDRAFLCSTCLVLVRGVWEFRIVLPDPSLQCDFYRGEKPLDLARSPSALGTDVTVWFGAITKLTGTRSPSPVFSVMFSPSSALW